jgi:hypothetical protein
MVKSKDRATSSVASRRAVLKRIKDEGVEHILFWFTDLEGHLKSFAVTPSEMSEALNDGMGFDGSSITGFNAIEESDMVAIPDPTTFQVMPRPVDEHGHALGAKVGRLICDVVKPDGVPYDGDPRYVMRQALERMKKLGFDTFNIGPDAERLELKGSPVAVLDNVMQAVNTGWRGDETGIGQFSVADNGTLVYIAGGITPTASRRELVWVNRKGEVSRLAPPPGAYFAPRVSPDLKRIAVHAQKERSREYMVWSYDMDRQTMTRLSLEGDQCCPVWSPNGESIAIRSAASSMFEIIRIPVRSTGERDRLTARPFSLVPTSWSSQNVIAFTEVHNSLSEVWTLSLDDREPKPLLQGALSFNHPAFSPDGRWIAYSSTESGTQEVYVQAFPGPGEKTRISTNGGNSPAWAADGELFYQRRADTGTQIMAVDIDSRKGFTAGKPHLLFEGPYLVNNPMRGYDVAADGQHFVMIRASAEPEPAKAAQSSPAPQMHVVLNWTEELKRRVPVR